MKKLTHMMTITLALLGLSAASHADTIDLAYLYVDAGGKQHIAGKYQGANGLMAVNLSNPVGDLAESLPEHGHVFCIEYGQHTTFNTKTYVPVTELDEYTSAGKAAMISQLWAEHYNPAWAGDTKIYTNQWLSGQPANTTENAETLAFSTLIYEIQYDFNGSLSSLNLNAGNIQVGSNMNPASATTIAQNWLGGLVLPENYDGTPANLVAMAHASYQDLIIEIPQSPDVPEPASLMLFGLGGLLMMHRRRGNA